MTSLNCGIYKITSPSGKSYIGSSSNLAAREKKHFSTLALESHANKYLQNAWNKYEGNLRFEVLLFCSKQDLLFYEQLLLDNFRPEYNILKVAGSSIGYKRTPETIEKHKQSVKGFRHSDETKLKMSLDRKGRRYGLGMTGRKHSEETKAKMKIAGLKRYGVI